MENEFFDPYKGIAQGTFIIPGQEDIVRQALTYDFHSIIDIGAGNLCATELFLRAGKETTATVNDADDYNVQDIPGNLHLISDIDLEKMDNPELAGAFDAVWLGHVLEHTLNPGLALQSVRNMLKDEGWLFLSVPPFKHDVVGGHVSIGWNLGVLMYFLILCGFNVYEGSFVWHGYNLSAFVRKASVMPDVKLLSSVGDLEKLRPYFPEEVPVRQGFDGRMHNVNWHWKIEPVVIDDPENYIPRYNQ